MFCPKCGTKNPDAAAYCSNCGAHLQSSTAHYEQAPPAEPTPPQRPPQRPAHHMPVEDNGVDIWLGILAFCVPIAGLILYFVWKDEKPKTAGQMCTISAISFGITVLLYIVLFLAAAVTG